MEGDTLHLAGADLIHGTPIIDVKPYLPYADTPPPSAAVRAPEWVLEGGLPKVDVEITEAACAGLHEACAADSSSCTATMRFFAGRPEDAQSALTQLLQADPRSVYRRQRCENQPYTVVLDGLKATCRFHGDNQVVVEMVAIADGDEGTHDADGGRGAPGGEIFVKAS